MQHGNCSDDCKFEWIGNVGFISELSIGQGLTPTFKVQRKEILSMYKELIEQLYAAMKV
jgi:hypothetical protein